MGLNLNISRIIFSTLKKFDGFEMRNLTVPEIKQIAAKRARSKEKETQIWEEKPDQRKRKIRAARPSSFFSCMQSRATQFLLPPCVELHEKLRPPRSMTQFLLPLRTDLLAATHQPSALHRLVLPAICVAQTHRCTDSQFSSSVTHRAAHGKLF